MFITWIIDVVELNCASCKIGSNEKTVTQSKSIKNDPPSEKLRLSSASCSTVSVSAVLLVLPASSGDCIDFDLKQLPPVSSSDSSLSWRVSYQPFSPKHVTCALPKSIQQTKIPLYLKSTVCFNTAIANRAVFLFFFSCGEKKSTQQLIKLS